MCNSVYKNHFKGAVLVVSVVYVYVKLETLTESGCSPSRSIPIRYAELIARLATRDQREIGLVRASIGERARIAGDQRLACACAARVATAGDCAIRIRWRRRPEAVIA